MKKILFVLMLTTLAVLGKAQTIEEGITHMENENFAAALNTFNSICKADPKASLAYFYIGEVNYLMEDYAEAEKSYKKGLSNNPQCAECNVGLGKLQLDKGNATEAEKYFSSALKMNKKSAKIPALIGDAYLYSKKPDAAKAVDNLSQARDMDPKVAKYWAHLGDAYNMSGNNGEAMTAYERAVEKDPANAEAYISMARIWANAKQMDLAIQKLEEAIRLSPNDARPIKDLYELYIQNRNYDKVTPLLEKYVALTGTDVDAKVRLVKFLTFQAKDFERAIIEGEKLLLTNPEQYTLHRWLAWAYLGKAKQMEANKASDKMVTDSLIKINYQKSYDHSEELFDAFNKNENRQKFPQDYDFHAEAAFKIGKLERAAHIYRKYLEFEPSRAYEIYGTLAKAYYDSTNYEQAINYYKRKGEVKPISNADEYYIGYSNFYLKNYLAADSSFAKVLVATPNFPQGWWMRARIGEFLDTISTDTIFFAKPFYEKYIELAEVDKEKYKRNLIEAYTYMAVYWVHHEEKGNVTAKMYYEKILELDPADEKAIHDLKLLNELK